jgi:hypothetical protein
MNRHSCSKTFLDVAENDNFAVGNFTVMTATDSAQCSLPPAIMPHTSSEKYGLHDVKSRSVPESRKC